MSDEFRSRIEALSAELDRSNPNMRAAEQWEAVKEKEKEQVGGCCACVGRRGGGGPYPWEGGRGGRGADGSMCRRTSMPLHCHNAASTVTVSTYSTAQRWWPAYVKRCPPPADRPTPPAP